MGSPEYIFRVRFILKSDQDPQEVLVRSVEPSEYMGLVTLSDFIFRDQTKKVILPDEDAARKRFQATQRLHIPYHNLISVEEIVDEPADLKQLPFISEVTNSESPDSLL